jgi:hypothetical protein
MEAFVAWLLMRLGTIGETAAPVLILGGLIFLLWRKHAKSE